MCKIYGSHSQKVSFGGGGRKKIFKGCRSSWMAQGPLIRPPGQGDSMRERAEKTVLSYEKLWAGCNTALDGITRGGRISGGEEEKAT